MLWVFNKYLLNEIKKGNSSKLDKPYKNLGVDSGCFICVCAHFAATVGWDPLLFYGAFTSFWMIKIYFHDFKPTICRYCHCCWLWLGTPRSLMHSWLPGEKIYARLDFCGHSSSPLCGQEPTMSYRSPGQWWLVTETPEPFSWVYKNAQEYLWVF